MKLQKMEGLVEQVEELVKQKIQFVENFPLDDLLNEDATELLKEADLLVASQVRKSYNVEQWGQANQS